MLENKIGSNDEETFALSADVSDEEMAEILDLCTKLGKSHIGFQVLLILNYPTMRICSLVTR